MKKIIDLINFIASLITIEEFVCKILTIIIQLVQKPMYLKKKIFS